MTLNTGGTLSVSGGTLVSSSMLQLGGVAAFSSLNVDSATAAINAPYMLNGGTLIANGDTFIGNAGTGAFVQTAGLNTNTSIFNNVWLGNLAGASGTYTLSGTGSIIAQGALVVGHYGNGTFIQSGGTQTIGNSTFRNSLYVGDQASGIGYYALSGNAVLLDKGTEYIGNNGVGTFVQSGGSNTADAVTLANATGASGTYLMQGGTLSLANLNINANGTFIQSAGTMSIGTINHGGGVATFLNGLTVDAGLNAPRYYRLNSGTVNVPGTLNIAGTGTGVFNANGGYLSTPTISINAGGTLIVGGGTISATSVTLNAGGTLSVLGGTLNASSVLQNDGTAIFYNGMAIDSGSAAIVAPYTLAGGTLSSNGDMNVGKVGNGVLIQTGGLYTNASIFNTIWIGNQAGSNGTYTLAGTGVFQSDGATVVGHYGNGTLIQNGGTLAIGDNNWQNSLYVGDQQGGSGYYALSSAGMLIDIGTEYVGSGGAGTLVQTGGTNTSSNLTVGGNAASSGNYLLSGGTLTVTSSLTVQTNGTFRLNGGALTSNTINIQNNGAVAINSGTLLTSSIAQSGGTLILLSPLTIAAAPAGLTANYQFSGGVISAPGPMYVGSASPGTFTQNGGTRSVGSAQDTEPLYVGYSNGGVGTYQLNSGTLIVNGSEFIGYGGSGTFTQSGGKNQATSVTLGSSPGVSGLYQMQAGTLSLSGALTINAGTTFSYSGGTVAAASVAQVGGVATFSSGLIIDSGAVGITAPYFLSGGTLGSNGDANIGYTGAGSLVQSGGTLTVKSSSNALFVGNQSHASGMYSLAGSGMVIDSGSAYVGNAGVGTVNQSGGTFTVSGQLLSIGEASSGNGTFLLGGGVLSVAGAEYIGDFGTGTFIQSGGAHSAGSLTVANNAGAAGTLLLSGGTLTVTNVLTLNNNGNLIQTGGALHASSIKQNAGSAGFFGSLIVDSASPGITGTYQLMGGTLTRSGDAYIGYASGGTVTQSGGTLSVSGTEFIGSSGAGTFIQTAGLNTNGSLSLSGGPNALYQLQGGTLNIANALTVGSAGSFNMTGGSLRAGLMVQNGGTVSLNNGVILGNGSNSISTTYQLTGGTLVSPGFFPVGGAIGSAGSGTLIQSGGTYTVASVFSSFNIGDTAGANGTFLLSGTGVLITSGTENIGNSGNGTVLQSGGTQTLQATMNLGNLAGSTGNYFLSNTGTLSMLAAETVGNSGIGTFTQTGGQHNVGTSASAQNLTLGFAAAGSGTYLLSSGALNVFGTEYIGSSGAGTFSQTGGVHQVGLSTSLQTLYVGNGASSVGNYSLSGGTLVVNGTEAVGPSGAGTFTQTAALNTTGTLTLSNSGTNSSTYLLQGGSLLISKAMNIGTGGSFTQSSGVLQAVKIVQTGGSAWFPTGLTVDNSGLGATPVYQLSGGVLATPMLTLTDSSSVGFTGGTINTGTLVLNSPSSLNWSAGTLNLTNSDLTIGPGGLFGSAVALGSGQTLGVIGFGNTLNLTGTLNLLGGAVQAGTIALSPSSQLNWNAGTVNITNSDLNVSPGGLFGSAVTVSTGQSLVVSGPYSALNVQGSLTLAGGTVAASTISLQSGASLNWNTGTVNVTAADVTVGSGGLLGSNVSLGTGQALVVSGLGNVLNITGNLTLAGGLVQASSISLQSPGQLNWTTGTLNLSNSDLIIGPGGLLGSSITVGPGQTLAVSGPTDILRINGGLNLAGGTVQASSIALQSLPLFNWTTGTLNLTNSNLVIGSAGPLGSTLSVSAGQNLIVSGPANALNINGTLTLAGGLVQTGSLTLQSPSSLKWNTGTLNITDSAVSIGTGAALGSTLNIVDGQTLLVTGHALSVSGTFSQSGGLVAPASLTLDGASASYSLGGTGALVVNSNETIGASRQGSFIQSGGSHTIGQPAQPAILMFGASSSASTAGSYALSGGTLAVYGTEYLGYIGSSTFTQSGGTHVVSGTLGVAYPFNPAALYSMQGGTLSVSGSEIIMSKGSFLQSGGYTSIGGTFSMSGGTFNLAGGTFAATTVGMGSGTQTVSAGTLIVNGGSLFPRTTGLTIGNGTTSATLALLNNASVNGPLTIASNSTLTGTASVKSTVTVSPGAVLAPGSPIGTMSFSAGLTLGSNSSTHSILAMDLGGDPTLPTSAGTTFDQLIITGGTFTIGGATLQVTPGSNLVLNSPYPIITAAGGNIDSSTMFSNLVGGTVYSDGSLAYHVMYSSSEVDVVVDSIPEPATFGLVAAGLLGCLGRRQRRRTGRHSR